MSVEVAPQSTDKLIGQVFANRYQLEEKLGEGAMGAVYKARHVKVGRPFAVKILHSKLLEDHKVAQRFEREAELAGRLRHPNVIGVVDVGETPDGLRYMVMDFAEGQDLAALLSEAPMPAPRIINLTRQMLEGLYHAHEAGLIHRDFKPENVIVERDAHGVEVPRIVDFGIAILREGGESSSAEGRLTTNGLVLGTPHYMAPEQAVADPIDHRIDLFAVGIVIYEMLCGKLPFDGTGAEVARANLLLDPPPIAQRVEYLEVDPLLEAFARKLMAKKRDHRPATAKAARELLDLVDKDPAAAAAALGVPWHASDRAPAITQPVDPAERPAERAVPSEQHAGRDDGRRDVDTSLAQPLRWTDGSAPASRRAWVIGGVAVAVLGGVTAIALRGGKTSAAEPRQDANAIVMKATGPEPAVTPDRRAGSADEPTPTEKASPDHVAPDPATDPIVADTAAAKAAADKRAAEQRADKRADKAAAARAAADRAATEKLANQAAADSAAARAKARADKAETQATDPVADRTTTAVKPDTGGDQAAANGGALTTGQLTALYSSVGRDLKGLGEAANDLWPRYRNINFNAALVDPSKRPETAKALQRLAADIVQRKK